MLDIIPKLSIYRSIKEYVYIYIEPKKVRYFDNDDNDKTIKGRTPLRGIEDTATNITHNTAWNTKLDYILTSHNFRNLFFAFLKSIKK